MDPACALSIIIPTLDESGILVERLNACQGMRRAGHELILVDGGSADGTAELARPLVDRLLVTGPGRARQMDAGARAARGRVLWFLHLDTEVPAGSDARLLAACGQGWGRFDVRLSGERRAFRVVGWMMSLRSRLTGIATGDQGIFVARDLYFAVGGFPPIPLMEDVDLSRRLRRHSRPRCLRPPLVTDSRRWERRGLARTVLLMWSLRLAWFLGADAGRLARYYRPCGTRAPGS